MRTVSFFFLTGAEVGEEAGGARRGIAGRWKRPETAKKTDFRWTQKPKKEREKAELTPIFRTHLKKVGVSFL